MTVLARRKGWARLENGEWVPDTQSAEAVGIPDGADMSSPVPDRDIDELLDLLTSVANRELDRLDRLSRARPLGLTGDEHGKLETLGRTILGAYRARPGRPVDPTEQRPGEDDADYKARLEAMR